jgi:adenosine deaminase
VKADLLAAARSLPKIELHRHLEGSVRLDTLIDIAREYSFEMPEYDS